TVRVDETHGLNDSSTRTYFPLTDPHSSAVSLQARRPSVPSLCSFRGAAPCEMTRRLLVLAMLLAASASAVFAAGGQDGGPSKLDCELQQRATAPQGHSRVILRLAPGTDAERAIRGVRGMLGRRLFSVDGQVADVPDTALDALSRLPGVSGISLDRRVQGT